MNRIYGKHSFSAALASVLELEAGQVPTFEKVVSGDICVAAAEFVRPRGLTYFEIEFQWAENSWAPFDHLGFWIFRGPSKAAPGKTTAVVMLGGKPIHDPNNLYVDVLELFDIEQRARWFAGFLIPFDPMRVRQHDLPEIR